jgi:hypothetical protein
MGWKEFVEEMKLKFNEGKERGEELRKKKVEMNEENKCDRNQ